MVRDRDQFTDSLDLWLDASLSTFADGLVLLLSHDTTHMDQGGWRLRFLVLASEELTCTNNEIFTQ